MGLLFGLANSISLAFRRYAIFHNYEVDVLPIMFIISSYMIFKRASAIVTDAHNKFTVEKGIIN
jgi:hypothetical protein